jgi:hypothetical protein
MKTLELPEAAAGLPVPSTHLFADSSGEWTHKALVRRMASWLKFTKLNTVVIAELSTRNSETPDVIAWRDGARSILIECPISSGRLSRRWRLRGSAATKRTGMGDLRSCGCTRAAHELCAVEMPARWPEHAGSHEPARFPAFTDGGLSLR